MTGTMEQVWSRPALRPMFWLLGWFGVLFPESGRDIPATLRIESTAGQQHWFRRLAFRRERAFNSTMALSKHTGKLTEGVGPFKILQMVWEIRVENPDHLHFEDAGWQISLFGKDIAVPKLIGRWVFGMVRFDQLAVTHEDRPASRIELRINHPLFQTIFTYSGVFWFEEIPHD